MLPAPGNPTITQDAQDIVDVGPFEHNMDGRNASPRWANPRYQKANMKLDIAEVLRDIRKSKGLVLRDIASPSFSRQTLSNYESGYRLPPFEKLEQLYECYQCDENQRKKVEAAYHTSLGQLQTGAFGEEPFLNLIKSARGGDHIVVAGQKSVIRGRPEMVTAVVGLLERGVSFTYLAHVPRPGSVTARQKEWQTNLDLVLPEIHDTMYSPNNERRIMGNVRVLAIGNPDKRDCYYLGPGTLVYLCRGEDSHVHRSDGWNAQRYPDGQYWWAPFDQPFLADLHEWMVYHCGLQLPYEDFSPPHGADAEQRQLRLLTLEEFVSELRS